MDKMDKKVFAVDVDLCVVDSVTPWLDWYTKLTGHNLGGITSENNNLEDMMKNHDDPLKFWRKEDLYDNLDPIPKAVKYLTLIKEMGVEIVFVSSCFPEHEYSKRMFLKRSFGFEHGFLSTSDKQYVRCDYFVDDYKKYCKQMLGKAKVFQIKTELNSSSNGEYPYMVWEEIYNEVKKDLSSFEEIRNDAR